MVGPFHCIADLRGQLLESPVWDTRRQRLFCCDILGQEVIEISLSEGVTRRWPFGTEVASLGLCESGRLVVALRREVILFDPETGDRTPLWQGFDEAESHRLNDGKVGPDGAFWVGSMADGPIGQLYRIDAGGEASVAATGIATSNGLAWTADGRRMFHSDSRAAWIDTYAFDPATGAATDRRRFHDLNEAQGRPDGGTCDTEAHYWSAGVSAGVLNRFAPDGRRAATVATPVPAPTMLCFCGPDLRQIAVTSHRRIAPDRLDAAPLSGGVFLAGAEVAGIAARRFADSMNRDTE